MVTVILAVIMVVLIAVLGLAATKPDTFYIQRCARIGAPPEKIFSLIEDLRAHASWTTFEKDPQGQTHAQRRPKGQRRDLRMGRQSRGRQGASRDHGNPRLLRALP